MPNLRQALYRCTSCSLEFVNMQGSHKMVDGRAVPPGGPPEPCPRCGSHYLFWLNYREFDRAAA